MELNAKLLPQRDPNEAELMWFAVDYIVKYNYKEITAKEAVTTFRDKFVVLWKKDEAKKAAKAAEVQALEAQLKKDIGETEEIITPKPAPTSPTPQTATPDSAKLHLVEPASEMRPRAIPGKVAEAMAEHGALLPSQVFADPDNASAFRGELCRVRQNVSDHLFRAQKKSPPDPIYQAGLKDFRERVDVLKNAVEATIRAWGRNIKFHASGEVYWRLVGDLKLMPDFKWLYKLPEPTKSAATPTTKPSINEMAKAESERARKALDKEKVKAIEAMLAEKAGVSAEQAEKMVARLLRKYPELSEDTKAMFTRAAINRQADAGNELNPTAQAYMLAAGLTEAELRVLVDEEKAKRAAEAEEARRKMELARAGTACAQKRPRPAIPNNQGKGKGGRPDRQARKAARYGQPQK